MDGCYTECLCLRVIAVVDVVGIAERGRHGLGPRSLIHHVWRGHCSGYEGRDPLVVAVVIELS